jgi:hypothetical protein
LALFAQTVVIFALALLFFGQLCGIVGGRLELTAPCTLVFIGWPLVMCTCANAR